MYEIGHEHLYSNSSKKDKSKEILTFARHEVISEGLEGSIAPPIPNVEIDGGEWSASRRCHCFPQGKGPLLQIEYESLWVPERA
jgi:hypothetical protein